MRASYNNKTANRWLSLRLELVGANIAGLAAVFATRVAIAEAGSGGNCASIAGPSLNYAISVTGLLKQLMRPLVCSAQECHECM